MSEIKYQHEEGESPEKPIAGTEIADQLQMDSILDKPSHRGPDAMNQVIQQCNVSGDMAQKLARGSRDDLHLLRMLRRSEAERNFSLAYLRHRDDIFAEDEETAHTARMVVGSEGADTMMFWTFAPYLFKALIEKGLTERDAIRKIIFWSKNGVTVQTESNRPRGYIQQDWSRLHLSGLEKYETETRGGWILDENPAHISHKYTEQEAKRIADILIAENGK